MYFLRGKKDMAGVPISSKTIQSGSQPWTTKAANAIGTVGKGLAIANGIREATPVVMGAMRTAGSLLPYLSLL